MSHPQQQFFIGAVKLLLGGHFSGTKVLEIGSLDINGSVRTLFEDCDYLGLDVGEGKGVDLVCYGEDYGGKAGAFDVVISCEAMEHNPGWRKTWLNMVRLTGESGLMLMTCATTGRRQHGTTAYAPTDSPLTLHHGQDYYRNLVAQDFQAILPCEAWFSVWAFYEDHTSHDLYFFGLGQGAQPEVVEQARQLKDALAEYFHKRNILGVQ